MSGFAVIKALTCRVFTSINHPAFLVAADVMDGWAGGGQEVLERWAEARKTTDGVTANSSFVHS